MPEDKGGGGQVELILLQGKLNVVAKAGELVGQKAYAPGGHRNILMKGRVLACKVREHIQNILGTAVQFVPFSIPAHNKLGALLQHAKGLLHKQQGVAFTPLLKRGRFKNYLRLQLLCQGKGSEPLAGEG